jgi:hypothetical protein
LWLAASLLKWIRWAWQCFGSGGYWLRTNAAKPQRATTVTGDTVAPAGASGSAPPASDEPLAPR